MTVTRQFAKQEMLACMSKHVVVWCRNCQRYRAYCLCDMPFPRYEWDWNRSPELHHTNDFLFEEDR